MEPIQHGHHQPRKKTTAKTSVTISLVIHIIIFAAGAYWAAHEGVLGKKLQELSVRMVPKEKKPEEKKEVKTEAPKKADEVQKIIKAATAAAPAPQKFVPPAGAGESAAPPPPVIGGEGFSFDTGGGGVTSDGSDPIKDYKQQVETMLRTRWDRPNDVQDTRFMAEVEMAVDAQGKITGYDWKKGSGDQRWDQSVKKTLAETKAMKRPPPKGFPEKFIVRFDVEPSTEPLISRAD